MTDRQKRFAEEYLIDLNAEAAAIRAGYSPKYARGNAHKLVSNGCISVQIQQKMNERSKRTEITQDMVLRELANIAFCNVADYVRVVEKDMQVEIDGKIVPVVDENGEPVKYKAVEPALTDDLTEEQQKALAVIQKGRDGFMIRTHDKLQALEKLGKHLGMWNKREDDGEETRDDGFMDALRGEVRNVWDE